MAKTKQEETAVDEKALERDLLRFADNLRSSFQPFRDQVEELRNLIFLEDEIEMPTLDGVEVARAPLAYEAVRTQVGHLTANPVRWVVHAKGESDDERAEANAIERWITGLFQQLVDVEDFVSDVLWNAAADGLGVLKAAWAPWSDFPLPTTDDFDPDEYNAAVREYVQEAPVPFTMQAVDPLTYFPLRSPFGLEAVVEHGYRPRAWCGRVFDISFQRNGKVIMGNTTPAHSYLWGDSVEYHEIWTRNCVYYFVSRKLVKTIEHDYPMIPYFEVRGETTGVRDPDKRYMSYVWPYKKLQPLFDTLLNVVGHHALRESHPSFFAEQMPGASAIGADGEGDLEVSFDSIIQGKPGQTLKPLHPPPLSQTLTQTLDLLTGLMDRTGGNPILGGYGGARTPGVTASQFMQAAKTRLQSCKRDAQSALSQAARFYLWVLQNKVKKQIRVLGIPGEKGARQGYTLAPTKADRYLALDAIIDLTLPQDDFALHMDAINLMKNEIISNWTAMERVGVDDPQAEQIRITVEKFLRQPEIMQLVAQWAMKMRGIGDAQGEGAAAMQIMEMLMSGMTPGGAGMMGAPMPPGPGGENPAGAPPGSGVGVGEPGNIPPNSTAVRSPGMGDSITPHGPGQPAMDIQQPPGRPPATAP